MPVLHKGPETTYWLDISQSAAKAESFMNKGRTWKLRSRQTLPVFKSGYGPVCKPLCAFNSS